MKKTLLLLGLLTGLICLAESEDLGRLVSEYAVKDGRTVWEVDRYGNRTEYEYNSNGLATGMISNNISIRQNYDKVGNIVETILPNGLTTQIEYDELGRTIVKKTAFGTEIFEYDKYDRLISRKGAGEYPLKFYYDSWGARIGHTDDNGSSVFFVRDNEGKILSRNWPDGAKIEYKYDGIFVIEKNDSGKITEYSYNELGDLIEEKTTLGDKSCVTRRTYDSFGRLTSISDGNGTISFSYDRFGRRLTEDGSVGKISNLYDDKGRLTAREVKFHDNDEAFLTKYAYDDRQEKNCECACP